MSGSNTTLRSPRGPTASLTAVFSLSLLMLAATSACADSPTAPTLSDPLGSAALSSPIFQGVYLGDERSTPTDIGASIEAFGTEVGKHPALVKTFFRLGDDFSVDGWAGQVIRQVDRARSTNFVALDLRWDGAPDTGLLSAITSGAADDAISRAASGLRDLGATVLIELGWEMNGDWDYPWQGVVNGGPQRGPEAYVDAWHHIVDAFRARGANNVRWVFSPASGNPVAGRGVGSSHWNWYGHYYPGDGYVDYVGIHGFNGPSVWDTPFLSFRQLFDGPDTDDMLSDLHGRFPDKPILISEFACEESPLGDKATWVRDAYRAITQQPGVVGAIWFDMKKEADWRIDSSASALDAYKASIALSRVSSSYHEAGVS